MVDLLLIVGHEPVYWLEALTARGVACDIQELHDPFMFDLLLYVAPDGTLRFHKLADLIPSGIKMHIDRLAILGPHRTLMHGTSRTDGHAIATIDAEVPRVRDGNGKLILGDQPLGTCSDAASTSNTQLRIRLDDRVHPVNAVHIPSSI